MGKRTKIASKDDVTWIKPETIKIKKIAAKCAHTKGNTAKLIKKHEEMIKKEVKNDWDELKKAKVKLTINNSNSFQKMITSRADQEESTADMELVIDEGAKEDLSDQEEPTGTEDNMMGTETSAPLSNNIQEELEETLTKVNRENTLTELKNARLKMCKLKEELEDRNEDGEMIETMEDQRYDTVSNWYSPEEELEHHLYHTMSKYDAQEEVLEEKLNSENKKDSEKNSNIPKETNNRECKLGQNKLCVSENTEVEDCGDSEDQIVVEILQTKTKTSHTSTRVTRSSTSPKTTTSRQLQGHQSHRAQELQDQKPNLNQLDQEDCPP